MHLMLEIRQELYKKGYIFVATDGVITGDVQSNGTHCHHNLKSKYQE